MKEGQESVVRLLRNTPVRALVSAIERDGFVLQRQTRTGGRIYRHPDARVTVIHYHGGNITLRRKTLRSISRATRWTRDDLERLGLI